MAAEALVADSPVSSFYSEFRGRAAQEQRSLAPHGERSIETILITGRVTLYESALLQVVWRAHITFRSDFVSLSD